MMTHEHMTELEKQYMWKAENIVRFLEKLEWKGGTKAKEEFVARELAGAYMLGTMRRLG